MVVDVSCRSAPPSCADARRGRPRSLRSCGNFRDGAVPNVLICALCRFDLAQHLTAAAQRARLDALRNAPPVFPCAGARRGRPRSLRSSASPTGRRRPVGFASDYRGTPGLISLSTSLQRRSARAWSPAAGGRVATAARPRLRARRRGKLQAALKLEGFFTVTARPRRPAGTASVRARRGGSSGRPAATVSLRVRRRSPAVAVIVCRIKRPSALMTTICSRISPSCGELCEPEAGPALRSASTTNTAAWCNFALPRFVGRIIAELRSTVAGRAEGVNRARLALAFLGLFPPD